MSFRSMTPLEAPSGSVPGEALHLHLDPIGGISGDMFVAAILNAWPDLAAGTVRAMRAAGLPEDFSVEHVAARDHGLSGSRVAITPPPSGEVGPTGRFPDLRARFAAASLPAAVRERAIRILTLLAEAEASVHGIDIADVHFHELADWDSVADIAGAAHLIETLGPAGWSVAPVPLGSGRIDTAHGPLPVPAPATALLLEGIPVIDDGVAGERVTPTGAAILRALDAEFERPAGTSRIVAAGYGFGTRRLPSMSNALRVLAFAQAAGGVGRERIGVIRFEVDDQTPEDLATGLARLAAADAVYDVCQWPAYGKKGRLFASVQVLCRWDTVPEVAEACLQETTTIGLRWRVEHRTTLERAATSVTVDGKPVAVKRVVRPGGRPTMKAEADDVTAAAETAADRADLRRRAEAAAVTKADD